MFNNIKSYEQFINELNHQTPDILGVNQIGFGQGAHVGNWGVNYGNPSQGVRGHFGEKGDKTSPNLPQKQKHHSFPTVVFDPYTNQMITEDEVEDIINSYRIKCNQNTDTPQEFNTIDSKAIEFMQNYINININM